MTSEPKRGVRMLAGDFWRLIADVARATTKKNLSHIAAGVAFYMLLSIFPAIVVALSLAGLFADVDQNGGSELLRAVEPLLPQTVFELLTQQFDQTVASGGLKLGGAAAVSFFIAFWSASAAMRALMTAMHIAFPTIAATNTLWHYVLSFAFTLGALACLGVVALFLTALPLILEAIRGVAALAGVEPDLGLIDRLETPLVMTVSCAVLTVVYRLGAARGPRALRAALRAGVIATVLGILSARLLELYFGTIGDFGTTYGPLAAFVGMMLWCWITALILLIGAELAFAYSTRTSRVRAPRTPSRDDVAVES